MENILPPQKNNLIEDSEGNEENKYSVSVSNKTKINDAKELNNAPEHSQRRNPACNH
jgi:hypothetical protein